MWAHTERTPFSDSSGDLGHQHHATPYQPAPFRDGRHVLGKPTPDCAQKAAGRVAVSVVIRLKIGPRPFLYPKSAISDVVWSQLHTAVSQFPADQRNRGGVTASF